MSNAKRYAVREIFDTFQGEGSRAGTRAVFIRFTGCNMWSGNPDDRLKGKGACARWCDTDFQSSLGTKMTGAQIADRANELWPDPNPGTHREKWVVLSGGEPLLQVDRELLEQIRDRGFRVAVETNGTVIPKDMAPDITAFFDHVTVSPKLLYDGTYPELRVLRAHELKVVLPGHVTFGLGWSPEHLHRLEHEGQWGSMYVQPMDPTDERTVEISLMRGGFDEGHQLLDWAVKNCLRWVKDAPRWRIGIQLHKVLNLP